MGIMMPIKTCGVEPNDLSSRAICKIYHIPIPGLPKASYPTHHPTWKGGTAAHPGAKWQTSPAEIPAVRMEPMRLEYLFLGAGDGSCHGPAKLRCTMVDWLTPWQSAQGSRWQVHSWDCHLAHKVPASD